jgi:hypothetical protein
MLHHTHKVGGYRRFAKHLYFASALVGIAIAGDAFAAIGTTMKTEAAAETPGLNPMPVPQVAPPRTVDVVVVWGFRIRQTPYDMRLKSVRSGYAELIEKSACVRSLCGFVVVYDGTVWRSTNVISGTEDELKEMHRNLERDGSTLVIVYPNGEKRTIPAYLN